MPCWHRLDRKPVSASQVRLLGSFSCPGGPGKLPSGHAPSSKPIMQVGCPFTARPRPASVSDCPSETTSHDAFLYYLHVLLCFCWNAGWLLAYSGGGTRSIVSNEHSLRVECRAWGCQGVVQPPLNLAGMTASIFKRKNTSSESPDYLRRHRRKQPPKTLPSSKKWSSSRPGQ